MWTESKFLRGPSPLFGADRWSQVEPYKRGCVPDAPPPLKAPWLGRGGGVNLSKIVSVLLSASLVRVGVSRMWDFFKLSKIMLADIT